MLVVQLKLISLYNILYAIYTLCPAPVDKRTVLLCSAVRVLEASPDCESGISLEDVRWTT